MSEVKRAAARVKVGKSHAIVIAAEGRRRQAPAEQRTVAACHGPRAGRASIQQNEHPTQYGPLPRFFFESESAPDMIGRIQ